MMMYRCKFEFQGVLRTTSCKHGIAAFKDGFWINTYNQWTAGEDAAYWIMPHKIDYIWKEWVE